MASRWQHLGLQRRVTVTAPVTIMPASHTRQAALAQGIILSGSWQLTRRD